MKASAGFTLIELIVTVAIVAILAGIVAPGMTSFIRDNRMTSQINTLIGTVHLARAEAANRRSIVTLCASDNAANCNSSNWEDGWIIFSDNTNNGNAIIDGDDELILAQEALEGGNTLRQSGFNFGASGRIHFNAVGFLYANDPTAGTLTLCDGRGETGAKAVILNIAGVSRLASDEDGDGIVNRHSGGTAADGVTCP
ncbi:GspH/FimT family pseudopilin [Motiliproteus sp. SC1-56]|uniref:GspH/FimT family pseudopilin n=1 Tax=Motiliproteus sp. SC1-56 TaxID=2799565 RepID=UPI001A8E36BB|nr:GspH/FimT family pseudopilin [Motiliproteus sp. SC1-56]